MSVLSHLFTGISNNVLMSWVLIMVGPVVFMIASMFARGIETFYELSKHP